MPGKTNQGANVELIIFGFLVSLTLKSTLDTAYGKAMPTVTSWGTLVDVFCSLVSLQVIVLLLTLIRFVYGAYRVQEASQKVDLEKWVLPWIIPVLLVLFVFFYIAGLCVGNPVSFYASLVVVHAWDLLAFLLPIVWSDKLNQPLKKAIRLFIGIDLATIAVLLALTLCMAQTKPLSWWAASFMVVCAVIDFCLNRKFYFLGDASPDQPKQVP